MPSKPSFEIPVEECSLSIAGFCRAESIAESTYYALKHRGLGPTETRVMGLVRITAEARRDWHKKLQSAKAKRAAKLEHQRRMVRVKLAVASPKHGRKGWKKSGKKKSKPELVSVEAIT